MTTDVTAGAIGNHARVDVMIEETTVLSNRDPGLAFVTVRVRHARQLRGESPPDCPTTMTATHVSFKRLDKELPSPQPAHDGDAAFDLRARQAVELGPGERASVPTGVAVAIPAGFAGLVLPRSGHAARHGIGLVNSPGLIDSGYRGEVSVLLVNHGDQPVRFERGDRIAQLMIVEVPAAVWSEVDELSETARGEGGFGSTGV